MNVLSGPASGRCPPADGGPKDCKLQIGHCKLQILDDDSTTLANLKFAFCNLQFSIWTLDDGRHQGAAPRSPVDNKKGVSAAQRRLQKNPRHAG
jgi:hypothetical protein